VVNVAPQGGFVACENNSVAEPASGELATSSSSTTDLLPLDSDLRAFALGLRPRNK